jgi:hypothetical protein
MKKGKLVSAPSVATFRNWRVGIHCYRTNWLKYLPSVAQTALSCLSWIGPSERSFVCWSDPFPNDGRFEDSDARFEQHLKRLMAKEATDQSAEDASATSHGDAAEVEAAF